MACCIFPPGSSNFNAFLSSSDIGFSAGRSHLVVANSMRVLMCPTSSDTENSLLKNTSSPTNRQLTVHLKRNCLENSNALLRYPIKFAMNGKAITICNCIMSHACLKLPPTPLERKRMTPMAGRARRSDILIPNPQLYAMLPIVQNRLWKK